MAYGDNLWDKQARFVQSISKEDQGWKRYKFRLEVWKMGRLLSKEIQEEWMYDFLTAVFLTYALPKNKKFHFWTTFELHRQLDYIIQNYSLY